jgi:hypothetical protein
MNFTRALILIGILGLVAGSGCGKKTAGVLATVGNQTITTGDLDRALANLPENYKPLANSAKGKHQILDNLVKKGLLVQEAEQRGYAREAAVKKEIKEYREKMRTKLQQEMEEIQQRLSAMPKQVYEEVLLTELNTRLKLEKDKQNGVAVADVSAYYEDYARKLKLLNPAAKAPDQPSVEGQIRAILVEEQLIKELEKQSRVHIDEDTFTQHYGALQEDATIQDAPGAAH